MNKKSTVIFFRLSDKDRDSLVFHSNRLNCDMSFLISYSFFSVIQDSLFFPLNQFLNNQSCRKPKSFTLRCSLDFKKKLREYCFINDFNVSFFISTLINLVIPNIQTIKKGFL